MAGIETTTALLVAGQNQYIILSMKGNLQSIDRATNAIDRAINATIDRAIVAGQNQSLQGKTMVSSCARPGTTCAVPAFCVFGPLLKRRQTLNLTADAGYNLC